MGLDTSHNAWHGSYNSFGQFRKNIAKSIGIDLDKMEGFGGEQSWEPVKSKLVPLLHHSDCDGEIDWMDCKGIAEELLVLAEEPDLDMWYRSCLLQFAKGAQLAYNERKNIEFH